MVAQGLQAILEVAGEVVWDDCRVLQAERVDGPSNVLDEGLVVGQVQDMLREVEELDLQRN